MLYSIAQAGFSASRDKDFVVWNLLSHECFNNSLSRIAVPKLRWIENRSFAISDAAKFLNNFFTIRANQHIGAMSQRHGSFRVLAQRDAWNAKNCRFLLDAARVS